MTTATMAPTTTMPLESPIGRLVLECDGDVLIGVWLPHERRHGRRDAATPAGPGAGHGVRARR